MRLQNLTWPEYHEKIASHLVVLPVGAVEAHGPHLPLATDTLIADHLAQQVAERLPALILPPLAYGVRTDPTRAGGTFPGMTNLRADTMTRIIADILDASYRNGARRFLILHGHIANLPPVYEAADQFTRHAPDTKVMAAAWWDFADEDTRNQIATETGVPRDRDHHAALVETSLLWHIHPDQVRADKLTDDDRPRHASYLVLPTPADLTTTTGVIYQASRADPAHGARLLPGITDRLVQAVQYELDLA